MEKNTYLCLKIKYPHNTICMPMSLLVGRIAYVLKCSIGEVNLLT